MSENEPNKSLNFKSIKEQVNLLENNKDFTDEKIYKILDSLDGALGNKVENFKVEIKEIENSFGELQNTKEANEMKKHFFLIVKKIEKIEKQLKKINREEAKILEEQYKNKGLEEITNDVLGKIFPKKVVDELKEEELSLSDKNREDGLKKIGKKSKKPETRKVSQDLAKNTSIVEKNENLVSEIEVDGKKYRIGDIVYYAKNPKIKYKIFEIRKGVKNGKGREFNDITLKNDVYSGVDIVAIADMDKKISKEKFPEKKIIEKQNLDKIENKQSEIEIEGVLYKIGDEVFFRNKPYKIKEIREKIQGEKGRVFNDLVLESALPNFNEVRVIQIKDVKKDIFKEKKVRKIKEVKETDNILLEKKENKDVVSELGKKYKKGDDIFILVAGNLIKKIKIDDIKGNKIHFFDKNYNKNLKLEVKDFEDFSNISKDKKVLETKITEREKTRADKDLKRQNKKDLKKQNQSQKQNLDNNDLSKNISMENPKKPTDRNKHKNDLNKTEDGNNNEQKKIEDLAKNALGDNYKEELIKIYKEKILNKEKEEKLIGKIKNILGSEYTKEIGEKIKDKIIEISIKEKKEHHDSDTVIAYVSKEVLEEENKPKYPKSHNQEFNNNLENFTTSKNSDPKIKYYEPVKTVEKSIFNKAEAWKSIFEYINENENFEKQTRAVQEDFKTILMLIEANDEKLLKQYFENSTEVETKNLLKLDTKFAWIFKLGEKQKVAVIETEKKISLNQEGKPKLQTVNEFSQEVKPKGKFSARRMNEDDFGGLENYQFVSNEAKNSSKQETEKINLEEKIIQENKEIKSIENTIDKQKELRKNSLEEKIKAIDSYFIILNSLKKIKISDGFSLTKMIDQEKDPERKKSLSEAKGAFMIIIDNLEKLNIDYSNLKVLEKQKKQFEAEIDSLDKPSKESFLSRMKNKVFSKETPEEKKEIEKNNQEKAKSIAKTLAKVIYGIGTSVNGVKFLTDSAGWLVGKAGRKFFDKDLGWGDIDQYSKNELKNENVKKEMENTFSEFIAEFQRFVILNTEINEKERTEITEKDNQIKHEMRDKIKSLREKILNSPDLSDEEKTRFKKVLSEILRQNREKNENEENKQKEGIKNTIDAFVYNKISKMTILKDALNTALVASGQFALRGIAYAITSSIERSLKASQQFNQENVGNYNGSLNPLNVDGLFKKDIVDKILFVLNDLMFNSTVETVRSLAGTGAKKDSKTKKTDFIKAIGKIFTAVGIYGVAFGDTDISGAFDRLSENINEKGLMETVVDNFTDNLTRLEKIKDIPGKMWDSYNVKNLFLENLASNPLTIEYEGEKIEITSENLKSHGDFYTVKTAKGFVKISDLKISPDNKMTADFNLYSSDGKGYASGKDLDLSTLKKEAEVPEVSKTSEVATQVSEKTVNSDSSTKEVARENVKQESAKAEEIKSKTVEFPTDKIEKAPIIVASYEIKSGQGLSHAIHNFEKNPEFKEEIIEAVAKNRGFKFDDLNQGQKERLFRDWKIEELNRHGFDFTKTGEHYSETLYKGAKINLVWEDGYPEVHIDSESIDKTAFFHDDKIRELVKEEIVPKESIENSGVIPSKTSSENLADTQQIKVQAESLDSELNSKLNLENIVKIKGTDSLDIIKNTKIILKDLAEKGDEEAKGILEKIEKIESVKDGPKINREELVKNMRNQIRQAENHLSSKGLVDQNLVLEKTENTRTEETELVHAEHLSGDYNKEVGLRLDKNGNVYEAFSKGDKVVFKNSFDILYDRSGNRIGFLGKDGAFHLHAPVGGYPEKSLQIVGIIKNKYEGQNGIKDFSDYKSPLDKETTNINPDKTIDQKEVSKPEVLTTSDSNVDSLTEKSTKVLAYKSVIENKLASSSEFKPYKEVFKKAVSFVERDLAKLKILVEKNPDLGLDSYSGRIKDLEQTILDLASEENPQNISNQIKRLWAVDSMVNSDIKILDKNLGLSIDDDKFNEVKNILNQNNGKMSGISDQGLNLKNFSQTNSNLETVEVGDKDFNIKKPDISENSSEFLKEDSQYEDLNELGKDKTAKNPFQNTKKFDYIPKDKPKTDMEKLADIYDNKVFEEQNISEYKTGSVSAQDNPSLRNFQKNNLEAGEIENIKTRGTKVDINLAQRMNIDKKLEGIGSSGQISESNPVLNNFGKSNYDNEAQNIGEMETDSSGSDRKLPNVKVDKIIAENSGVLGTQNNQVFEKQNISESKIGSIVDNNNSQKLNSFTKTSTGEVQDIGKMATNRAGLDQDISKKMMMDKTLEEVGSPSEVNENNLGLKNFGQSVSEETQKIGNLETNTQGLDKKLPDSKLDKMMAQNTGVAGAIKNDEAFVSREIPKTTDQTSSGAETNAGKLNSFGKSFEDDALVGEEEIEVNADEAYEQVLPKKEVNYYNLDNLGKEEINEKVSEMISKDENLKNILNDVVKKVKIKSDLFSSKIAGQEIDSKDYFEGVKFVEIPARTLRGFAPDLSTNEATAAIIDGLLERTEVDNMFYKQLQNVKLASLYKAYADKLEKIAGNEVKVKFLREAAKKIVTGSK